MLLRPQSHRMPIQGKKRAMKISVWRLIMWGLKVTYTLRYFSNWVESREDITLPEQQRIPGPSVSGLLLNGRMTILLFSKNNSSHCFPEKLYILQISQDGFQNWMVFLITRVTHILASINVCKCHKRVEGSTIISFKSFDC